MEIKNLGLTELQLLHETCSHISRKAQHCTVLVVWYYTDFIQELSKCGLLPFQIWHCSADVINPLGLKQLQAGLSLKLWMS